MHTQFSDASSRKDRQPTRNTAAPSGRSTAASLSFQSLFELGDQLRQRLGQRDVPGVAVIGAQPLTQYLADVALCRSVEQGQIVRHHGTFLRGSLCVRRLQLSLCYLSYMANAWLRGAFPRTREAISGKPQHKIARRDPGAGPAEKNASMFLADAGRIGTERRSGAAANIGQKPLQALDILPVDCVLADRGTRRVLRLYVGAKFTAIEATGAAFPRRVWINDGTTIRALHGRPPPRPITRQAAPGSHQRSRQPIYSECLNSCSAIARNLSAPSTPRCASSMIFSATSRVTASSITRSCNASQTASNAFDMSLIFSGSNGLPARNGLIGTRSYPFLYIRVGASPAHTPCEPR